MTIAPRAFLPVVLFCLASAGATGATIPVTNANDSGPGSLRQAIADANNTVAADTITFNISGTGLHTIALVTPLPAITQPVTIDGYTQPGASANTNGPYQGLNSVLRIEIDGTNGGNAVLDVKASDTTIRGLVINRSSSRDLQLMGDNITVEGNFLGTSTDGTATFAAAYQDSFALTIVGGSNDTIGGTTPAARNLVNGRVRGIEIGDAPNTGHRIQGNLIGTNAAGTTALSTTTYSYAVSLRYVTNAVVGGVTPQARNVISGFFYGVVFGLTSDLQGTSATGNVVEGNAIGTDVAGSRIIAHLYYGVTALSVQNTIGGTAPGAGNVIAGCLFGIGLQESNGTIVHGNFIGTDPTGTIDLGNTRVGVDVLANDCIIGGPGPGEGNVIAFNGGVEGSSAGVAIESSRTTVRGNSIYGTKTGLGIDIVPVGVFGVTPNDPGDADTGPNGLQNFPVLSSVTYGPTTTTIQGSLNSSANTTYTVDFYANPLCTPRPRRVLEGKMYLGSIQAATDSSGNASFTSVLPVAIPAGSEATATATDPLGETSEFSQGILFSMSPATGPASGDSVTIAGIFQNPATVTVGGVPATNVSVASGSVILARTPALPPGTVNAVTVTSGGHTGTLPSGWVTDFTDVPAGNPLHAFVDKLLVDGVTAGCGGGNYCLGNPVSRSQMAVFLLRGRFGLCYAPPPATGTVFGDVPAGSPAAAYIEALAAAQVTTGCGGGNYCPASPVTRAQMAVFLLRTLEGPAYFPPVCTTASFADVPCSNGFSSWIDELQRRNITGGCGGGNYCPNDAVTRGQMAVFVATTFALP